MEIETKNASLATMAVTIQALHVNGKQMTLAVFRQLPIGTEDNPDQVWGTVRYNIKDEGDLWIVFSKDGRLFRRALHTKEQRVDNSRVRHITEKIQEIEASIKREGESLEKAKRILQSSSPSESFIKVWENSITTSLKKIEEFNDELAVNKTALQNHTRIYHHQVVEEEKRQEYEFRLSQLQQLFIAV